MWLILQPEPEACLCQVCSLGNMGSCRYVLLICSIDHSMAVIFIVRGKAQHGALLKTSNCPMINDNQELFEPTLKEEVSGDG